jgi:predicted kinase
VLELGLPILVDATFLKQRHRARFIELATELGTPVFLLDFYASPRRLAQRVWKRSGDPWRASDAGPAVLVRQLANEEPLTPEEAALTVGFDTDVPPGSYENPRYWHRLILRLQRGARHGEIPDSAPRLRQA